MQAKKVLFIRHAECVANTGGEPIISGNSPLTQKGHAQAEALARRLRISPISSLHASSLERAQVTASYIGRSRDMGVVVDDLYIERLFPKYLIGRVRKDRDTIDLYRRWEQSFICPDIDAGDGENFSSLRDRADRVLCRLASMREPFPAIVTHGFLLRMVFARICLGEHVTPDTFRLFLESVVTTNTGIHVCELRVIERKSKWRILSMNDHSHLVEHLL